MLINELISYLFDGKPNPLTEPVTSWLAASRRFTAFVNAHHTKIRKKIRIIQGIENLRDLQLELESAYLLLRESSLSLTYEPQHPELGRSPDFAVTFTTSLTLMVEVTRLRPTQGSASGSDRFSDMLCSKLGQLSPKRGNLLLVGIDAPLLSQSELHATMLGIQRRVENNDSDLLLKHGFRYRADFFQRYQRLSGILVRAIPLQAGVSLVLWDNPQAKYPLPARVRTALIRSHTN